MLHANANPMCTVWMYIGPNNARSVEHFVLSKSELREIKPEVHTARLGKSTRGYQILDLTSTVDEWSRLPDCVIVWE